MADQDKKLPQIKATTEKPSMVKNIGKSVYDDIIVPKSKDLLQGALSGIAGMISDAVQSSISRAIYGEDRRPANKSGGTSYTSYYTSSQNSTTYSASKQNIGQRSSTQVEYIYVDTEDAARSLVDALRGLINDYGCAKVGDLYSMLVPKKQTAFTDYKYGWTNPNSIGYEKVYSGPHGGQYMLDLPKPVDITNA